MIWGGFQQQLPVPSKKISSLQALTLSVLETPKRSTFFVSFLRNVCVVATLNKDEF